MIESGSRQSLPAQYRIGLAIPIALLIHTLIFMLIRLDMAPEEPEPDMIKVTLSRSGNTTSVKTEPTAPSAQTEPVETPPPTSAREELLTSEESETQIIEPEETTPKPVTPRQHPVEAPRRQTVEQTTTQLDREGNDGQTDSTEEITQINEPAEQVSYIDMLAARIVSYGRPYLNEVNQETLTEATPVEVELTLMDNGALMGAAITKSSGDATLDRAAYRGALGASPYPAPPEDNKEGNRFRVTLIFSPERI